MTNIKIEFPADDKRAANALGAALLEIGGDFEIKLVPRDGQTLVNSAAGISEDVTSLEEFSEDAAVEMILAADEEPEDDVVDTSQAESHVSVNEGGTGPVDLNGVVKDERFCGTAEKPFYASGKRKDQWKKRQGVRDEDYDAWYAEQLAALPAKTNTAADETVDTAAAFGGQASTAQTEPAADVPKDCGAFMGWVSGQQAGGLLTQEDIGQAYVDAGVQVTDLFPPNDEATVAVHVTKLYALLSVKAVA